MCKTFTYLQVSFLAIDLALVKKINKKLKYYFIFLFILIFLSLVFSFYKYQNNIYLFLGEYTFLKMHQNNLAINLLKTGGENYYNNYLLGRIYFVENKLFLSAQYYTKSMELNPEFKESYYGRGLSYGYMGQMFLDKAQEDFQKYIELDNEEFKKTDEHGYGAWAGYNDLAWIYFLKNDFKNQENIAREGLKLSSENPWLLNMLAVALLSQNAENKNRKNCAEAKEYLEKSKKLLGNISDKEFGEAYSGDHENFWIAGKKQMQNTIDENLLLCENKF